MSPSDLGFVALQGNDLAARQIVKDAKRDGFSWGQAPAPTSADPQERSVYAALVALLASRDGEPAPAWVGGPGPRRNPHTSWGHPDPCAGCVRKEAPQYFGRGTSSPRRNTWTFCSLGHRRFEFETRPGTTTGRFRCVCNRCRCSRAGRDRGTFLSDPREVHSWTR